MAIMESNRVLAAEILRSIELPSAIGLVLGGINKIIGYFRTDYAAAGVALTFQDSMLLHALAGKVAKCYDVQLPAVYNPAVHSDSSSAIWGKIDSLVEKRQHVKRRAEQHRAKAKKENGKDADKEKHRKVAAVLEAAADLYNTFFSNLTTPVDGNVPLSDVQLQTALVEILKQGGRVLIVKIQQAGGAHYTKRNIGTLFGSMPFYHMGGAVVSFVLLQGNNGNVEKSGVVPIQVGFVKANKIKQRLKLRGSQRPGGL